ncbi:MAG: DUF2851 family protein [Flavobacteriales bacterium]|nr:DUF2851 family protein [Flavobacteriales bacterium]
MREEFLHYIWKFKLFTSQELQLVNGEALHVIHPGIHNTDSGPDFFNARIRIGTTEWAGNVEIHVRTSDWYKHRHEHDPVYQNIILHVVYQNDKELTNTRNQSMPTLELKSNINRSLYDSYADLLASKAWIPCGKQIQQIDAFTVSGWLNRLAIERMERKAGELQTLFHQNGNDWESSFYQYLFRYFGMRVNAEPCFQLARNAPLKLIEKHADSKRVEALLFGQAGMLTEPAQDEYTQLLKSEYAFLQNKFSLRPMSGSSWKLMRLRPANFPTIRISQMAQLMVRSSRLFASCMEAQTPDELIRIFQVKASTYWEAHYQFGKPASRSTPKPVGEETINHLIINVVVPFTFVYGKWKADSGLQDKAIQFLEKLKPEKNSIVKNWENLTVKASNALQSQSLLELKNNYCSEKKCLNCSIGNKILKHDH